MQDPKEKEELTEFLNKVDDLEAIMKGLTSNDPQLEAEAIGKADIKLNQLKTEKSGFDRTVINKEAFKDSSKAPPSGNFYEQHTSQNEFMSAMEADCQRRLAARKERHQKANLLKEKGNKSFNRGEYDEAIKLYSEGMEIAKDLTPLYTNRAAAYLKVERFQDAIDDCEFSLRIDDKWTKAFVFKARALQKLKRFTEAINSFEEILKFDKKKSKAVQAFIAEVEEDRQNEELERNARLNLESGESPNKRITSVINTLRNRMDDDLERGIDMETTIMYYAGGLRVIQTLLVNDEAKTLFRTEGGFDLFVGSGCISTLLCARITKSSKEALHHTHELLSAVIGVATAACIGLLANLKLFFSLSDVPQILLSFFECDDEQVKRDAITFFHEVSLNAKSRLLLYDNVDCKRLFLYLLKPNVHKADVKTSAAAAICNLSLDGRCRNELQDNFQEELMPIFADFMNEVGSCDYEALGLRLRCLLQLVQNSGICDVMANSATFRNICILALDRCVEQLQSGLTQPCSFDELLQLLSALLQRSNEIEEDVIKYLTPILLRSKQKDYLAHSLNIMGVVLGKSKQPSSMINQVISVKQLLKFMKHDDVRIKTHSLKILTLLGRHDPESLKALTKLDAEFKTLLEILRDDSSEAAALNQSQIALLLSMLSSNPACLKQLREPGSVVRYLLVLCRDSPNEVCRANSAIALGKMAVADQRFLEELRIHDGINILAKHKPDDSLL